MNDQDQPTSRGRTVLDALESMILGDAFADGERLDEMRLAERFGVSRTPVREAFQHLAASGLVELKPRRGAFVRRPSFVELVEMFEVMGELEALCGRRAARLATLVQRAEIARHAVACDEAARAGEPDAYYSVNELFHRAVYVASGSAFLAAEAKRLHQRLRPYRRTQLQVRGRLAQSSAEHHAIVRALEAGDENEAAKLLRAHVAIQGERFHDLVAGYGSEAISA